jgi:hypothetical protein
MLHDRDFPLRRNKDACRARDMRVAEVFGIDASNQAAEIAKTTPTAASSAVSLAPTVAVHKLLTSQKVLVTGPNSKIAKRLQSRRQTRRLGQLNSTRHGLRRSDFETARV